MKVKRIAFYAVELSKDFSLRAVGVPGHWDVFIWSHLPARPGAYGSAVASLAEPVEEAFAEAAKKIRADILGQQSRHDLLEGALLSFVTGGES